MIGIIFSALFLGFFTGRFFLAPIAKPLLDTILMTALAVMVFCAGADIGSSRQIVRRFLTVKTLGLSLLVLLATNVGSLGGGLIMGYLMGVPFRDALLVSAGMGWYSLSSVLLSAAVGTETGTLAFLANALRELLTILGIPLLARFCHLPLVLSEARRAWIQRCPSCSSVLDARRRFWALSMDSFFLWRFPFFLLFCSHRQSALSSIDKEFFICMSFPLSFS